MKPIDTTIKQKQSRSILSITLFFSLLCSVTLILLLHTFVRFNAVLDHTFQFTVLSEQINQIYKELDDYVKDPVSHSLDTYDICIRNVENSLMKVKTDSTSPQVYYAAVGLSELFESYRKQNDEIIRKMEHASFTEVFPLFTESQTIYGYLNATLSSLANEQNRISQENLRDFSSRLRTFLLLASFTILTAVFVFIQYGENLSKDISRPIVRLTDYARQMTLGDYGTGDISLQTDIRELETLAGALNNMKHEIQRRINAMQEKSILEVQLQEEQLKNLKISNTLRTTELKVLQSQVNPHFLFNTLNSINRLAYLSGNEPVVDMIEALSDMLHYNLQSLGRPITLDEELDNLKNYIRIQKMRFQDRLSIRVQMDSIHGQLKMPCMILQPLVENSIDHGLKPHDYWGEIHLHIYDDGGFTIVDIHDDGIGMDEETCCQISSATYESDDSSHSGIGFKNVSVRLTDYFGEPGCISVSSQPDAGTTITLKLKHHEEGEMHV